MFSDDLLERVFGRSDVSVVPLGFQSTMIHAIEEELEKEEKEKNVDEFQPGEYKYS